MESLTHYLSKVWNENKGMINHCLKSSTYLDMGDYYLDVISKPSIDKDLYYSDMDVNGDLAKDPGTSWNYFYSRNMRSNSPDRELEQLSKKWNKVIVFTQYNGKDVPELKSWSIEDSKYRKIENSREATPEEVSRIIEALEEAREKYIKRLKTYYKRYAKNIRTSSYWADR